jgi:hypothetical protein
VEATHSLREDKLMQTGLDVLICDLVEDAEFGISSDEKTIWFEFATVMDAEGVLDGLSENDQRHVVAALFLDPDAGALRYRSSWVLSSPGGREPLDDPAAVAEALGRVADLMELPC